MLSGLCVFWASNTYFYMDFSWSFAVILLLLHSFIIYVNNKKYNLHLWFWGGDLIYRVSKFPLTQMKGVTGITYAILSERLLTVLLCDNLVKCLSLCSNKLFVKLHAQVVRVRKFIRIWKEYILLLPKLIIIWGKG